MIARSFPGSTLYPDGVRFPPKKRQSLDLNTNFFALKARLFALAVSKSTITVESCVALQSP